MENSDLKIPDLNKAQKIKIMNKLNKLNDKLGHPIYEDLLDTWLDAEVERERKKKKKWKFQN